MSAGVAPAAALVIKWIVCTVPETRREAFARAQTGWAALHGVDGFGGQVGGWDERRADRACVIGLWRDRAAHERFMREVHDGITGASGQARTYERAEVALHEVALPIAGAAGEGLAAAVGAAVSSGEGLLRIAECEVAAGRERPFERAQREVWNPAMAAAGCLGGAFARRVDRTRRFLVATVWPDAATHARYLERDLPGLREAAAVERDLVALAGFCAPLRADWSVPPT